MTREHNEALVSLWASACSDEVPPQERVLQMILGSRVAQVVYALATFSVADHMATGPKTAYEIAKQESLDPDATFRLLRTASSLGLLTYVGESRFAATRLLGPLRAGVPGSLKNAALCSAGPGQWLPWGRLSAAIRTGEPQARPALGCELWDHYANSAEEAEAFSHTMAASTDAIAKEVARVIDTRGVGIAVDVGGSDGTLLKALLVENSDLRGIVFDLPHVIERTNFVLSESLLNERIELLPGNFFHSLPEADLFLLKYILHDWNDKACIEILRNCRRALQPRGRVIIVELLLEETGKPGFAPLMDLAMLVLFGGRERTFLEYEKLLVKAGFTVLRTIRTQNTFLVIEAAAS